jgi:hypothetical protein
MDEDLRYKHAEAAEVLDLLINADEAEETSILYTDPMGNTFETIDFHNAVTADPGDDDDDDLDIWTEVPLKEEEPFEIDENQEWTGENASTMSTNDTNTNLDILDFSIEEDKEEEEDKTSDFF